MGYGTLTPAIHHTPMRYRSHDGRAHRADLRRRRHELRALPRHHHRRGAGGLGRQWRRGRPRSRDRHCPRDQRERRRRADGDRRRRVRSPAMTNLTGTTRVALFALLLAAVFTAAAGTGRLLGPTSAAEPDERQRTEPMSNMTAAHDTEATEAGHGDSGHADGLTGLASDADGYRMVPGKARVAAGRPGEFSFRILDHDGQPVTSFVREHEREMHLIVVRRDLSGFQHLHPT